MSQYIVDVTSENFQQVILEASSHQPVLVFFYVQGHEPCDSLSPALADLANEYQGGFTLAKVDCNAEQMLAAQFQIQAVPTLYLVRDGRPVDGLAGPQTKDAVAQMLDKHVEAPLDPDFEAGLALLEAGNTAEAIAKLSQAMQTAQDPHPVKLALIHAYLQENRLDEAEQLLGTIAMKDQDADYKGLLSELQLKKDAADTPEIRSLTDALAENPDDNALRLKLAVQLHAAGRNEEALDSLMTILRTDLNFQDGEAKKTCLDILSALGQGNALAAKYRRQLFSLLY
ncbi:thioredoxin family protein [Gallaecimonas mangrovi]|uniref:thioredoxin family protein n=1 Tax=Gallaecimonas mangrovi TaxID=2291597 RepID=UPI000E1FC3C1|nr:co-chaperone YbbN [Gallaecimonas mangrovi]